MGTPQAIFLDRAALVAEESFAAGSPQVALRPGVAAAIASLRGEGWRVVVTSNERRVARGELTEPQVQQFDAAIASLTADDAGEARIDRFYFCPFDPDATESRYRREHAWRKPGIGMFEQAAADLGLSLSECWVVAATADDAAAARSLGCRCVRTGPPPANGPPAVSGREFEAASTVEAAAFIVSRGAPRDTARIVEARPSGGGTRDAEARADPRRADPPQTPPAAAPRDESSEAPRDLLRLEQGLRELAEELRLRRAREREFSGLQVVAIALQLAVLLAVVLGLLQWKDAEAMLRWFLGAVVLQLTAIAVLLLDRR